MEAAGARRRLACRWRYALAMQPSPPLQLDELADRVQGFFRKTVDPLRERFRFVPRPSDGAFRAEPMVLFVGNHSSGKSTLINHFLGAPVQETGMAPTHDDFTILRYGAAPREITGESLVSNPDFGFAELAAFGPSFVRRLKMRSGAYEPLRGIQLVDTPGMIDSADRSSRRDYDFDGVITWFARRADLVVLFFDPERPGTTAETVDVFARALASLDHKLVVVLNKVDLFQRLSDFARCYGTLCWNLGKVLRVKDIPQIHPSYVPSDGSAAGAPGSIPLEEFDAPRRMLLERIRRTPDQRADNLLTETSRYAEQLLLHAEVLDELGRRAARAPTRIVLLTLAAFAAIALGIWIAVLLDGGTVAIAITASIVAALVLGVSIVARRSAAATFASQLEHEVDEAARAALQHHRKGQEHEDRARSTWEEIRPVTLKAAMQIPPSELPRLRRGERKALEHWLEQDVPQLRQKTHRLLEARAAAPEHDALAPAAGA